MSSDGLIEFLRDLLRIPSPAGREAAAVERVLAEMHALGYDAAWRDDLGSAVGVIDGGQPGPTLLLDGHIDTVGVAPGVPWHHDPFGAELIDGAIYGRGASDMKGAIAAMVHAAAGLDRARLAGRVVVSASVLEEVIEGAALLRVMEVTEPAYVVIGEASGLDLVRGGRGRAEISLETTGIPSHSSRPDLGRNAVYDMLTVVDAVRKLPMRTDPLLGPGILALTDIISEPYPGYSVIPSRCRATFDRRLLAGETAGSVLAEITSAPAVAGINLAATIAVGEHETYTGVTLRPEKFLPAWTLSEGAPLVQMALAGLAGAGLNPQLSAYQFCTNAAYSAGIAGIPTIGFGPGKEERAHVIDEYLLVGELVGAERGYRAIIEAVLGTK
jgi:putative selenium metabolism hydrolase